MANRNVVVKLSANVAGYVAGMNEAARETYKADESVDKLQRRREGMRTLGVAALGVGTAITGMAVMAAKAAIDWESAWTGVEKVLDAPAEQLATVEQALRDMSREVPATHAEIAATAEAAARLGVAAQDVPVFTRAMIDMGEATDLSADQAATQLARMMNIMGTSTDDVAKLGSAVVDLGNNFAASESEIVEMSMRLAGAGAQIGLTEGEVTGLGTALAAVGIEAQAGGSAFSKVMIDIESSVDSGGDRLAQFAEVAGMSADEFAQKWQNDPGAALQSFVQGLADAESQGKSTIGILNDMGITEIRMRDALLRASGAAGEFSRAMGVGNEAFAEGNALADEAARRYATVESQLKIAGNSIVDAGISLGSVFLPAVANAATAVADFAEWFAELPPVMQDTIGVAMLVAGGVTAVSGALVLAIPKLVAFKASMEALTGTKFSFGKAFVGMGAWGLAIGGAVTAVNLLVSAFGEGERQAEQFAATFDSATGEVTAATRDMAAEILGARDSFLWFQDDSTFQYAERLEISSKKLTSAVLGNANAYKDVTDRLREIKAMSYDEKIEEADRLGITLQELNKATTRVSGEMHTTQGAIEDAADAMGYASDSTLDADDAMSLLNQELPDAAGGLLDVGDAASEAEDEIASLGDELRNFTTDTRSIQKAQDELQKVIADAVESLDEYTASGLTAQEAMSGMSDGGISFRETLDEIDQAARNSTASISENNGSVEEATAAYEAGREKIVEMITSLGASQDEAEAWADKMYGTSESVVGDLNAVTEASNNIPENENIDIFVLDKEARQALEDLGYEIQYLPDGTVQVEKDGATFNSVEHDLNWLARGRTVSLTPSNTKPYYDPFSSLGSANGNIFEYANGGFGEFRGPDIYRGGENIHKFAEPETGWEAYISGKPSEHDRNVGIWQQAGERLGIGDEIRAALSGSQQSAPMISGGVHISSQNMDGAMDKLGWKLRTLGRGSRG